MPTRRHEIDALRSIALLLLIVYHVFAAFLTFAPLIQFIGYPDTLERAWFLGELINPWRIPVLFLIAGVTAGYLLPSRPVGTLLASRMLRLVPPLLATSLFVFPLCPAIFQLFHGYTPVYAAAVGHLWFVWNLIVYFIFGAPWLLYLKHRPDNPPLRLLARLSPYGWLLVLPAVLVTTTWFLEPHISPDKFAAHSIRFWYGFACFLAGTLLVSLGDRFWDGIRKVCHLALPAALTLYGLRMARVDLGGPFLDTLARCAESGCAMLAFLGYGSLLFRRPSRLFSALNRAVFAVYIIHLPVQQATAFYLFRLDLPTWLTFVLHLSATLGLSALVYVLVLRPIRWLHPFFGIAPVRPVASAGATSKEPESGNGWLLTAGRFATLFVVPPILVLLTLIGLVSSAVQGVAAHASAGAVHDLTLREAIFADNRGQLRAALDDGADVNRRDENGWTDFSMAIFARNPEALQIMLAHGPDLSMRSNDGQSLLWAACWISDADCARLLLEAGIADSLGERDLILVRHALRQPYEAAATQIRSYLQPQPAAGYLANRRRIRALLKAHQFGESP